MQKKNAKKGDYRLAPEVRDGTGMFAKMRRLNFREDIHLKKEVNNIEILRKTSLRQINADIIRLKNYAKRSNIPLATSSEPLSYTDVSYSRTHNTESSASTKTYGFSYCTCSRCIKRPRTSISHNHSHKSHHHLAVPAFHVDGYPTRTSKSAPPRSNMDQGMDASPSSMFLSVPGLDTSSNRTSPGVGSASLNISMDRFSARGDHDIAPRLASQVSFQMPNSSPTGATASPASPWKQDRIYDKGQQTESWAWRREPHVRAISSIQGNFGNSPSERSPSWTRHTKIHRPKTMLNNRFVQL